MTEIIMNRLEIRKTIQASGNDFYNSLPEGPLQQLAGEIMGRNEEYVLNHSGVENTTVGALSILRDGFTTNQKNWLRDLKKIVEASQNEMVDNEDGLCRVCRHTPFCDFCKENTISCGNFARKPKEQLI